MKIEALSTVVESLESGKRPKGGASGKTGKIPSLGGEHLNNDGGFRFKNLKYIDEQFFAGLKKGAIKPNDILIVKDGATTGKVSYVDSDFPFERAAINEHLFALTVNTKITNARYVFSFLKSPQGQKEILKDFRGAAIGGISRGFVELTKIPLPSLNDQIRIAHLLGKVEGLIIQRKQHLQQLDDLLKSVFMDMFGDPVRNEKGWDTTPFHKIGQFISGGTPSKSRDDFWVGSFPWVSPKDMKVAKISDAVDHISERVFEETNLKRIAPNHLLIVVRGMILAHSFPVAINTVEIAINQDMKAIKPTKDINVVFLQNCLAALKRQTLKLISSAGHGTRKFDSVAMQKLFIPKPPKKLQNEFVAIAEKVELLKSRYQQSLTDFESLYGAFSQKAFKGQLDLSKVPFIEDAVEETPEDLFLKNRERASQVLPETEYMYISDLIDQTNISPPTSLSETSTIPIPWVDAYLESVSRDKKELNIQLLIEVCTQKWGELFQFSDTKPVIDAYDLIKKRVFQKLQNSELIQDYDDVANKISLSKGNQGK